MSEYRKGCVAVESKKPLNFRGFLHASDDAELLYGTRGRTRTGMRLPSADFESAVSTISPLWQKSRHYTRNSSRASSGKGRWIGPVWDISFPVGSSPAARSRHRTALP